MTLKAVLSQRLLPAAHGGRVATREIMVKNSAVANLIRENKIAQIQSVIESSGADGMMSEDRDIKHLLEVGLITKEVAETQLNSL